MPMHLHLAPASAHPPKLSSMFGSLFSRRSAAQPARQHPADYRSNGLQSHVELPMATQAGVVDADHAPAAAVDEPQAAKAPAVVPYVAFFIAVFASMAAAAAVVSNDLPVMVVGLM